MSDPKKAARDQTAYQLNLAASSAQSLKIQGEESARKRGKSFEPQQIRIPNPEEEKRMNNAAEESLEKRNHVTENIAKSYRESSSS
ncbi:uncharacterized protein N7515_009647 [Penicillium bovifimosum]|uniref:Uncharacterized protein n=1 Tax=Penicillium bovifimosum TaxID=126998 RepID=A0A9W9KUQ2_9EURO|nr:uncharacterized protein N7515_009647 [Penicillium bovifimosum]KAJ5121686.1 hypothetical protein N7515_009647 [Penicillium bovifimosum]